MTQPAFLKVGDQIGLISTARKISTEEINASLKVFQNWGLKVKLGLNLFAQENQFAGSDEARAADFQQMINDSDIKAIICVRGGYGSVRIIDKIDFGPLISHPKWIVGYSDITVIHSHFQEILGMCSLHATMPYNFPLDEIGRAHV